MTMARINGDYFRRAAKSAITATLKTGRALPILETALITIQDGAITIEANDCEQYFKATIPAQTDGLGTCANLPADDLKKLLNIKGGTMDIEFEQDNNRMFVNVTDGKKKMKFVRPLVDREKEWPERSEASGEQFYRVTACEFAEAIKRHSPFVAQTDINPTLYGYGIYGADMVTIDGYHVLVTRLRGEQTGEQAEADYVISKKLENFKNIYPVKGSQVEFMRGKKYVHFVSTDEGITVEWSVRRIEGVPHPVRSCKPKTYTGELTIDANMLGGIVKEAKSYIKASQPMPIIFGANNGNGFVDLKTAGFQYTENFTVKQDGTALLGGYKAAYMLDGLGAFSGDVHIRYSTDLMPLEISQGVDWALVLPVRLPAERKAEYKTA